MKLKNAVGKLCRNKDRRYIKKLLKYRSENRLLKLYARCLFDILTDETSVNFTCRDCTMKVACVDSDKDNVGNREACIYKRAVYNSFLTHLSNDKEVFRAWLTIPNVERSEDVVDDIVNVKRHIAKFGHKFSFYSRRGEDEDNE